jgi:DNA-binding transcriptional LysR family regulator
MQLHHMRHFLAVAHSGNLTRAAEELGIAQPALSQSIKRMETLLGVPLFSRSRRGATLTTAGRAILEDVRLSISRIDAAKTLARQIAQGSAGTLRIAFVASAEFELLPRALRAHRALVPNVQYVLREMNNAEQVAALQKGEIDIAVLYTPEAVSGRMKQRVLSRHPFIAVIHDDIPVGGDGKVSLRDLAQAGLVFFGQDQVPHLRVELLSAMQRMGEQARVVQEANHLLTVLACVAAKCGISLLSGFTRAIAFHGVRFCEVREQNLLPTLEVSAIWPAYSRPTLADGFASVLAGMPAGGGRSVRARRGQR